MANETQCFQYDPRTKRQHTNEIKIEKLRFQKSKICLYDTKCIIHK